MGLTMLVGLFTYETKLSQCANALAVALGECARACVGGAACPIVSTIGRDKTARGVSY